MKIFKNSPVEFTIQNLGTGLLLIARGNEQTLTEAYNGVYNFGLSNNDEIEWGDGMHTIFYSWTTPKKLKDFFKLLFWLRTEDEDLQRAKLYHHSASKDKKTNPWWDSCQQWVSEQVNELMENKETILNYYQKRKEGFIEPYKSGNTNHSVIEPGDFKESVLQFAFAPKD